MSEDERLIRDELTAIGRLLDEWKGASADEAVWIVCELHQSLAKHESTLYRLLS